MNKPRIRIRWQHVRKNPAASEYLYWQTMPDGREKPCGAVRIFTLQEAIATALRRWSRALSKETTDARVP